jgi:hypothetical protein
MWKGLSSLAVAAGLSLLHAAQGSPAIDTPPPVTAAPKLQFFAGTVTEIDEQHVKVSRTLVGRPSETRSFLISSETKINRLAVKVKTRVTVRYRHSAAGDIVLEIQIRPTVRSKS